MIIITKYLVLQIHHRSAEISIYKSQVVDTPTQYITHRNKWSFLDLITNDR